MNPFNARAGLVTVFLSIGAWAVPANAQTATLLVRTDAECGWSIDGEAKGVLKLDDRVRLSLPFGEHLIEAVPVAGGPRWEQIVKLAEPTTRVFTIPLQSFAAATNAAGEFVTVFPEFRRDANTGLMWAGKDNGFDATQPHSLEYCRNLNLAGFRDWRLPTLKELQAIQGTPVNGPYQILGGIKLSSGLLWSSSPGESSGQAWELTLGMGIRSWSTDISNGIRALCVRSGD